MSIEDELRAATIAILSDMLEGLTKASTSAPEARSAPQTQETPNDAPGAEWGGLTRAEPPAPTEERVHAAPPWPEGSCPRHNLEWKQGQFGPYCVSKEADQRFSNRKGYCRLRPGDIYQGRLIPRVAA